MDLFAKLMIGNQAFKSKVALNQGKNPKWNEDYIFNFDPSAESNLVIEIWEDDDKKKNSEFLGMGKVTVDKDGDCIVDISKKGKKLGQIQLKIANQRERQSSVLE